jgi:hypothetical protein
MERRTQGKGKKGTWLQASRFWLWTFAVRLIWGGDWAATFYSSIAIREIRVNPPRRVVFVRKLLELWLKF